jgi:transposase
MKAISPLIKDNIIIDLKSGLSTRQLASKYGVSQSKVSQIAKTIKEEIPPRNLGRPSQFTRESKIHLIKDITNGSFKTAVQAQDYLSKHWNINVSTNRIRQVLKGEGLSTKKKTRRPKLSMKQIQQRMDFVHMYEHWTTADWRRVLWTDETKVNRIGSDGKVWAWKNPRQKYQKALIDETVKHGGGSVFL